MIGGSHKSPSLLPGKVILIIITVMSATGGFALGYIVGQSVSAAPATTLSKQMPGLPAPASALQKSDADFQAETRSPEGSMERNTSGRNPGVDATPILNEPLQDIPATAKPDDKSVLEKTGGDRGTGKTISPESAVSKKKAAFTVQAGAFKRQKDADALKHSLEAKGYQVSVKKESNPKTAVFFKVRVGEFERKEEASVVALKLKKNERLNAFIIAKN